MSGKRATDSAAGSSGEPPSKRQFVAIPPVNLGPIATEEELDIKVLKFQNRQLYNRLEEKNAQEEELKAKATDLERLRANDQSIISASNRAWNQLDEDVNLLLQRFQDTNSDDGVSETTVAFLERLSNRTTKGMEEEMQKRVTYSELIISKLVKAIDKTLTRSMDISKMLLKPTISKKKTKTESGEVKEEETSEKFADGLEKPIIKTEPKDIGETISTTEAEDDKEGDTMLDISAIELAIKQENAELKGENARLHSLVTSLHDKYNSISSEFSEVHDKHETVQKDLSESNTKLQDMQYDLQKAQHQVEKLIKRINEIQEEGKGGVVRSSVLGQASDSQQDDDLRAELEEMKELSKNRLSELEKMHETNQTLLKDYETLKNSTTELAEKAVLNSVSYKTLQSQFTLLFAEGQQLRNQVEEARKIAINNRNQHILQMEQLEGESNSTRKKIRGEVGQLERALMDSRRELELLRVEYEHNMKAHEQIGPMAREMRHLINSLQNHNQQLKGEVMRSKRKLAEAMAKIPDQTDLTKDPLEGKSSPIEEEPKLAETSKPPEDDKAEDDNDSPIAKSDPDDTEYIKKLKSKLKLAKENQKEMKLLLDMYKGASKETRDKAELLRIEKQLREEVHELRKRVDQLTRDISKRSNIPPDEDAPRKLKHAEETIEQLKRSLTNTKQEEDALLAEMEFTAQAFEEMQEQNIRLMQQLREKDDANLKLMSERIKANQVQKLLREEKEVLQDQVAAMNARYQAMEEVIKRLEEREKVLQNGIQALEKEMALRQQASELHKRKALETTQQSQELQYKLDESDMALGEAKESLVDKSIRLEEEAFKCRRMYEENTSIKRKLEKAKKMEYLGASDEILVEEVKMYKSKLTCPCCNTRRKDAILTKCFHVFCFECLKTRYDTRQRKCPKCNATFGNNDFHKIYM